MIGEVSVLIALTLLNAVFAMTEIAFISLNDSKISKLAKDGDKKAKQIEKMLRQPSKFLATIQIGITLAGFLSSAFASQSFARELVELVKPHVSISESILTNISIVLITIILSYFTLVFGELVPKRIGMKKSEWIARNIISLIKFISVIFSPFVKLLTASTNIISKLFGVSETDEEEVTEEEIRMMIDVGEEKGSIEQEEKEMINNIFEFNDKIASEVMTHRMDICGIEVNDNIEELYKILEENKYSRIPVYEDTVDTIVGVLHLKDLFKYLKENKKISIKKIMREAYFVSETKRINELFRDLQKSKTQMAIVVDEYGGTAGLITMEDMLEEIVGNIFDEYDEFETDYEKIDDNTFRLSGSLCIADVEKILNVKIPEGEYDTLSGYIFEILGRIPDDEEKPEVETEDLIFKIEEYEDKRIMWVKVCKIIKENTNEDEE